MSCRCRPVAFGNLIPSGILASLTFLFPWPGFASEELRGSSPGCLTNYTQRISGTDASFDMVAIPGGTIAIGSPENEVGREASDLPQKTVTIRPFWIGRSEVTWETFLPYVFAEWDKFVKPEGESDGFTRPTKPYGSLFREHGQNSHPALGMSYYSARQFCRWLSARTGLDYRLPTEQEWEYACRAGSRTAFHWGEDGARATDYGWFETNSDFTTHPVGKKRPNKFGLFDMAGNVAEWCGSESDESPKVVRGGAFTESITKLRNASRLIEAPEWNALDPQIPKSIWWLSSADFVGIRVVRSMPEETNAPLTKIGAEQSEESGSK